MYAFSSQLLNSFKFDLLTARIRKTLQRKLRTHRKIPIEKWLTKPEILFNKFD